MSVSRPSVCRGFSGHGVCQKAQWEGVTGPFVHHTDLKHSDLRPLINAILMSSYRPGLYTIILKKCPRSEYCHSPGLSAAECVLHSH